MLGNITLERFTNFLFFFASNTNSKIIIYVTAFVSFQEVETCEHV